MGEVQVSKRTLDEVIVEERADIFRRDESEEAWTRYLRALRAVEYLAEHVENPFSADRASVLAKAKAILEGEE